ETEAAASQGAVTLYQTKAGAAAMLAYGKRPTDVMIAGEVAYAAARSSFTACAPSARLAPFVIDNAMSAVYYYELDFAAPGAVAAFADAIWNDLEQLILMSSRRQWTAKSAVSPSILGPLWPDHTPQNWPAVNANAVPLRFEGPTGETLADRFDLPSDL